jgi:hypothetical protein
MKIVFACVALALIMGLARCGPYSFSTGGASPFKNVAVPLFEDRTAEFGVKEQLTDAIIAQFNRDNTLKIADRRVAESVVLGILLKIEERAGAFNRDENVQEIRVYVNVDIKYENTKKRRTVWQEQMTQFGSYAPGSSDRAGAIREAIDKIAQQVLNKAVAGW